MGYILKDADDLTIVKSIETVYQGGQFLSPLPEQRLLDTIFRARQQEEQTTLTRREKEVLELIMQEYTIIQDIADKLFISLRTADNHRSKLVQKLKIKNTAGRVKKAMEKGLID